MVSDEDEQLAYESAGRCAAWLRKKLPQGTAVLGPAPGVLVKASGQYRFQILIKSPRGSRKNTSAAIRKLKDIYTEQKGVARLLTVDINPYSFV